MIADDDNDDDKHDGEMVKMTLMITVVVIIMMVAAAILSSLLTRPCLSFTSGRTVVSVLYPDVNKIVSHSIQKNVDG